jgi:hypothetical protein
MRPQPQYRKGPRTAVLGPFDAAASRARGIAVIVAMLCVVMMVGAGDARATVSIAAECTPAPTDCSAWYRSNVSLVWTVSPSTAVILAGCQPKDFITDTPGTTEFCRARNPQTGATATVEQVIKVDKTAPVVTGGAPARGADANGWYNHAVPIAFSGSDQTSGIAACTSTTYGGPDSGAVSLSGTCIDAAGNMSSAFPYGLKYDETAPVVVGANPERSPNAVGWFNRPVRFDVAGTDATAGIADCPSVTYGGADSAAASFTGTCRDQAGNTASRTFGLKYDSTPPPILGLEATTGDRRVALEWTTTADAESLEVARTPGRGSEPTSVVFRGPGERFVDRTVRNGVRYVYELRLGDAAGNGGSRTVSAVPGYRLVSPAVVRVERPPLLRWTPVRGARYYNLQVFRGGRKILSVWPSRPRYKLTRRWSYGGKIRRLVPGRYRWRVWPGYGPRSKGDYGKQIGPRTFTLVR